jgi:hypothetical protein
MYINLALLAVLLMLMLIIVKKNFSQGEVANVVPVQLSSNNAALLERNGMFDAQQQISYGGNEKKVFFSVTAT